ncbi:MAG: chemotaxis protein CheW [Solirubrobacteraceae bacterium]
MPTDNKNKPDPQPVPTAVATEARVKKPKAAVDAPGETAAAGEAAVDQQPVPAAAGEAAVDHQPVPAAAGKAAVDHQPVPAQTPVEDADDELSDSQDFVTFSLSGELFAFPMDRVQEIIRMPDTVKVPLTPRSLVGLANLRGRVLPVVSLRSCCSYAPAEADEATRVIVVDCGVPLGFVVDRVAAVISVEPERIDDADSVQATVDARILSGVIKEAGGELVAILDVEHVVGSEFHSIALNAGAGGPAAASLGVGSAAVDEQSDDTFEMVSFTVDRQEYALPIDEIQEIVQAAESVIQVPNADTRMVGVMDLRGRLLPLVSLRRVFGLTQQPLDETSRIVVVPLRSSDGRRTAVGVVMDTVREVLRVPRELVDPVPSFVARAGTETEVESVCRLDDGNRLVSVLSANRLFSARGLQAAIESYDTEEVGDMEDHNAVDDGLDDDEQLVVFRVDGEEYCLSVDAVQEIIRVPDHLIHVPETLDFVEGLVNLRGAVLPVIDLRSRLGIARGERDDLQRIVVVIIEGTRTGFIVDSVAEVIKLQGTVLQDAPELSGSRSPMVGRVANLTDSKRMLLMLDHRQLLGGGELEALVAAA